MSLSPIGKLMVIPLIFVPQLLQGGQYCNSQGLHWVRLIGDHMDTHIRKGSKWSDPKAMKKLNSPGTTGYQI